MSQHELKERQKQVIEAEQKVQLLKQKVNATRTKADSYNKEGRRSQLTEAELKAVKEGVNCYKSVGRMFVLRPTEELIKEQQEKQNTCEAEVKKALALDDQLTKSLQEAETEFQKMYKQFMEEVRLVQGGGK
eukprot:TRINITY_DN17527_c0_g1_i3.p2 TRINITY_DN17527_c0_g1~~TRINITY_DN17527_c0_g1_i3.p2  ORF type:complete len:132 (+),score=83.76 TRINITY_DN17527_c0_g1_i3:52-447(+)